jgi:pSer/pThr/pTyr-binding forkhead associated (FHA) protein
MSSVVKLSVFKGELKGPTFVYERLTRCTVGGAFENDIRLPSKGVNRNVSLFHCIFEIDPPYIWIRALDAKNGTYVNNLKLSIEAEDQPVELRNGDEVRIGSYLFIIHADESQLVDAKGISDSAYPEWIL